MKGNQIHPAPTQERHGAAATEDMAGKAEHRQETTSRLTWCNRASWVRGGGGRIRSVGSMRKVAEKTTWSRLCSLQMCRRGEGGATAPGFDASELEMKVALGLRTSACEAALKMRTSMWEAAPKLRT